MRVPVANHAAGGAEELGKVTARPLGDGNAALMGNHGLVAVGRSLKEAFYNALSVEYTAIVNMYAKILGSIAELPREEVANVRRYVLEQYA